MLPDVVHLTLSQAKRQTASEKKKTEKWPGRERKSTQNHVFCWFKAKFNMEYKYYNSVPETCGALVVIPEKS